jgi:hypothetical protein
MKNYKLNIKIKILAIFKHLLIKMMESIRVDRITYLIFPLTDKEVTEINKIV